MTIGWEIEFLVPLAKGDVPNEILQDGRYFIPGKKRDRVWYTSAEGAPAREHIAKPLRQAGGIPTIHTMSHDLVQVSIAAACLPDPEVLDVKNRYTISKVVSELDCNTEGSELDFDYVGVELNSRKLAADEAGFAELEQVLRLTRNNVLVSLTRSCGLHVHVDASCFDPNEQRHFVSLYIIVENLVFPKHILQHCL